MNTFKFKSKVNLYGTDFGVLNFIRKVWQIGVPFPVPCGALYFTHDGGTVFEVTFTERAASGRIPGNARLQAEEFAKLNGCMLLN